VQAPEHSVRALIKQLENSPSLKTGYSRLPWIECAKGAVIND
jgi:hypothetical protein